MTEVDRAGRMTITEIDAAVAKMTAGEWHIQCDRSHFDTASDIAVDGKPMVQCFADYPQLEHDAVGIAALKNGWPAVMAELAAKDAEIARLREALSEIAGYGAQSAAEYGCANCNDFSDRANAALGGDHE